jgi:hypothetical protein
MTYSILLVIDRDRPIDITSDFPESFNPAEGSVIRYCHYSDDNTEHVRRTKKIGSVGVYVGRVDFEIQGNHRTTVIHSTRPL